MTDSYTGVRVVEVDKELIDRIYRDKKLEVSTLDGRVARHIFQNEYVVLKYINGNSQSALCRLAGETVLLLNEQITASGLKPRNKEQRMALDALLDDKIKVVCLSGLAGSGKSLLSIAAALQLIDEKKYKQIVISKNMVQVGADELGYLKGDLHDKFMPFNQGVLSALDYLVNKGKKKDRDINDFYDIEYLPLAIIRGSSFNDTILIIDEAQNMTPHEVLTAGTRVSENSKIIMLGDLDQIDLDVKRIETGLFKFVNSQLTKESPISASIELIKSERGEVAKLFSKVFRDR